MGTITARQSSFLKDLLAKRQVSPELSAEVAMRLSSNMLSSKSASDYISRLLALPYKPKPATATAPFAESDAKIMELDTAFYAIPSGYVAAQQIDLYGNDHLFIRVRTYGSKRRMYRVFGSVGGFSYRQIRDPRVIIALAAIMKDRELEFQQNFHKVTGRCGRCAADLTDLRSRETGFGPDCRKVRGIK